MPAKKTKKKGAHPTKGKSTKKKDICFTVMPFGGWLDDYYENIYCPAIKAAGLVPRRADDLYRPSAIVHDIWELTKKAKIILADLTGKNPNVLYELGLAHAIAKPAILITESLDDIPFDLRSLRIIEYDKNASNWGEVLRGNIESSIKEILSSPLKSVLPAFLEVSEIDKATPISPHEKEIIEIKQELDLLRREMRSGRRVTTREIYPKKARALIREMIDNDIPTPAIFEELTGRRVPYSWVEEEIEKYLSESDKK